MVTISVCLKFLYGLHAVSRAQETREGVFGHQVVDPLLCLVECVGTQRVHHGQQTLPGLSVQVYLRKRQIIRRNSPVKVSSCLYTSLRSIHNFFFFKPFTHFLLLYRTLVSTNLLRGVGVDKLAVDTAGLGLWRRNPVVLTGQPELEVLLTELWTQEPTKHLQTTWERGTKEKERTGQVNQQVNKLQETPIRACHASSMWPCWGKCLENLYCMFCRSNYKAMLTTVQRETPVI